jgi:hypothetical protein
VLLALVPAAAAAQDHNNLDLHNGGDGIFFYNDPSVGHPPGTFPIPSFDVDFWYRVFPKEVLLHPLGTLELTGYTNEYSDTDWVTTPTGVPGVTSSMHDMILTPGVLQPGGTIVPALPGPSPLEVDIVGLSVVGLLPNPCPGSPVCSGPCPLTGFVSGYVIAVDFMGAGPVLQVDGLTDWTWSTFVPGVLPATTGGMTLAGGACGIGDFILQDFHSSNVFGAGETQAPSIAVSKYGGFQVGNTGAGNWNPDGADEVYAEPLEFGSPIAEPMHDAGAGMSTGLGALNPWLGGGANSIAMRYRHASGAPPFPPSATGELAFFFASTFPLLPRPGISLLDIHIVVNIADPLAGTIAGIWAGFIVNGQGTFQDDATFDSVAIPLPSALAGFSLQVQGFNFDRISDFDNSQALLLPILP